jgi:hypothetical protein
LRGAKEALDAGHIRRFRADRPASSALTQKQLGWHPVQIGLIPDLDEGHYVRS